MGEQVGGREGQVGEKRVIWVKSDERGGEGGEETKQRR